MGLLIKHYLSTDSRSACGPVYPVKTTQLRYLLKSRAHNTLDQKNLKVAFIIRIQISWGTSTPWWKPVVEDIHYCLLHENSLIVQLCLPNCFRLSLLLRKGTLYEAWSINKLRSVQSICSQKFYFELRLYTKKCIFILQLQRCNYSTNENIT